MVWYGTVVVMCFSGVGVDIVRKALRIPCHTIAANAGVDADEVVTRVMRDTDVGYDAMHDQYVDMMKSGIIDPTKVYRFIYLFIYRLID